jgi:peptide/nickel transport system permease protein
MRVSQGRRLLRRLVRNRGAMVGLVIISAMALLAIAAPWIAPHDPFQKFSGHKLEPPSREFLLGTDNLSRDLFSRLVYGARPSIGAAAAATVVIIVIGITIGAWAGYLGGLVDEVLMRIVDVLLAFPTLILALAIVAVLGTGLVNLLIAVTSLIWASYARLVRGIVLELRERPFVKATIALGAGRAYIVFRHILPNIVSPVIVLASLQMGVVILIMAGMSFLGLGIQPPNPEWGAMLNAGKNYFQRAPQLMIYPGVMISLTVMGFNLLGDGLRDVLDPRHTQ